MEEFDVIVIGAGPGGSTAALNAVRAGLKTAFFESMLTASSLTLAPYVENYPGFEGKGYELLDLMRSQAMKSGAVYKLDPVKSVEINDGEFVVKTDEEEFGARAVIIATGGKHKELNVPGEKENLGKGVSYCAVCDGNFFKGKKVLMIGGGYGAVNEALYLKNIGCDVTVVTKKVKPSTEEALLKKFEESGIPVIGRSKILRIEGDGRVEQVVIQNIDTKEEITVKADGVFIAIGKKPQTEFFAEIGLEMDPRGYIKVDRHQRTSIEGIFAAGDCCDNPLKQIVTACGDGAVAAQSAYKYLKN